MPRVPISTGGNAYAAFSFVSLVSRVVDLSMPSFIGAVEEAEAESSDLRRVDFAFAFTCGLVLVGKLQRFWGIFLFGFTRIVYLML